MSFQDEASLHQQLWVYGATEPLAALTWARRTNQDDLADSWDELPAAEKAEYVAEVRPILEEIAINQTLSEAEFSTLVLNGHKGLVLCSVSWPPHFQFKGNCQCGWAEDELHWHHMDAHKAALAHIQEMADRQQEAVAA